MGAEKAVYRQFLQRSQFRFRDLHQLTGIRSNLLAYTLNRLIEKGQLRKDGEQYMLTAAALRRLPYFREDDALSPLPTVLVRCQDGEKTLLLRRQKRPYEELWSLPGGRMLLGDTIREAAWRVLRQKAFIDAAVTGVRAVCNERVVVAGGTRHGFVLFVVDAIARNTIKEKTDVRWFSSDLPETIIPSDAYFLSAPPGVCECTIEQNGTNPPRGAIHRIGELRSESASVVR